MLLKLPRSPKTQEFTTAFIAAGLFWSVFAKENAFELRLFFLICVAIAGIFGALTLPSKDPTQPRNIKTLFLQTLPATIAIVLVWIN
jgi:putative membrane protein